jgi:hypothetical protein
VNAGAFLPGSINAMGDIIIWLPASGFRLTADDRRLTT